MRIVTESQKQSKHESYLRNKVKIYENNKRRRKELRAWFAEITKDNTCLFCGESCSVCLDYHHRNPEEKLANVSKLLTDMRSRKMILAELAKCDCMCSNCHRKHEAELI